MTVTADTLDNLHIQRVRAEAKLYLKTWRQRPESSQTIVFLGAALHSERRIEQVQTWAETPMGRKEVA